MFLNLMNFMVLQITEAKGGCRCCHGITAFIHNKSSKFSLFSIKIYKVSYVIFLVFDYLFFWWYLF